jgi:hypothetical protein
MGYGPARDPNWQYGKNSDRVSEIPPGVCQTCDGRKGLWAGGFLGKPNKFVTCQKCNGTGTA